MKKILLIIAAIFSVAVLVYATRPDSNGWIRMYYQCAHCGGSNTLTQHKNQTGKYCNNLMCGKCGQHNYVCFFNYATARLMGKATGRREILYQIHLQNDISEGKK